MTDTIDVLIIGAGMAGLAAARTLAQAGRTVTLLDKGRGVGGRMATRRIAGATFDHGAQYFTVRDDRFRAVVDGLLANGAAREWARGFPKADGDAPGDTYPRYVGVGGMNAVPKALAAGLDVHVSTQVTRMDAHDGAWHVAARDLATDDARTFTARALLLTPPAEQTLALLNTTARYTVPGEVRAALERIQFNPCFAVLATLDAPSRVPAPGGVFMPGEPISWLADNAQKGVSGAPCVTIHAGPEYTRAHFDDDQQAVAAELMAAAQDYLGARVIDVQIQRWRYSQPTAMHDAKTVVAGGDTPLALAGDAFDGARVEGAFTSGVAAAEALLGVLR